MIFLQATRGHQCADDCQVWEGCRAPRNKREGDSHIPIATESLSFSKHLLLHSGCFFPDLNHPSISSSPTLLRGYTPPSSRFLVVVTIISVDEGWRTPRSIDQGDLQVPEKTLKLLSGDLDSSPRSVIGCVILRKSLYLSEPLCAYLQNGRESPPKFFVFLRKRLDTVKHPALKAKASFFPVMPKTSPSKILKPASLVLFINSWWIKFQIKDFFGFPGQHIRNLDFNSSTHTTGENMDKLKINNSS